MTRDPSLHHLFVQSMWQSIQHDNLLLAAGSLVVSSCNFVPCLLGILLSLKLKHRPRSSGADESHLRVRTTTDRQEGSRQQQGHEAGGDRRARVNVCVTVCVWPCRRRW